VVSLEQVREHFASDRRLPAKAVLLTFDDGYENNLSAAYPTLKEFGHSAVIFPALDFMGGGILPHDRHLATENVTLGWDDLKSMLDVFDVGSHACSHRTLTSLSPAEATEELRRSKETLESRLEQPIVAFSYPKGSIGDFNQETDRAVRDAGYELVFTTLPGTNLPPMDPFHLRRHNVEDFGLRFFKSLLDGSGDLLALKDTRLGYAAKARLRKTLHAERG
jgi:peptidoglycan/xylan/chitin deacetylase (PgdA/CDA1 family)